MIRTYLLKNANGSTAVELHPSDALMKVPSFGPLEKSNCNLCGNAETSLVVVQHWFAEDFSVVRCGGCGMIRTNPRPTSEWKTRFYDPKCNDFARQRMGRDFIYAPAPDRLPSYQRILRFITSHTQPGSRLIDIGAASGVFAKMASDAGFDAVACDYSEDALSYAEEHYNIATIRSPAENIDTPDNSFDIITILHTVEHLPDPQGVLKELYRILRPGGMIFLETPNYLPHYLIETRFRFLLPVYKWLTKGKHGLPWVPFDHYYHWMPKHLYRALKQAGFNEVSSQHILGYRSNTKPNFIFWCTYIAYDFFAEVVYQLTLKRWDLRLVLLASGKKPVSTN